MDIEFHYYMTYIIARRAGFKSDEAYIIAYSSQYTDDNNESYDINEGEPGAYSNYISQTMDIFKPQTELMRIYPVFHFLPGSIAEIAGDSARRSDGKLHLLNTTPNSQNGKRVLSDALGTGNLYRIGIATHTYADTFAHQNFVGANDGFNDMAGLLGNFIPSIGHADARHDPDVPNRAWKDRRLVQSHVSVDNKGRFLEAAGCIFDLCRGHPGESIDRDNLLADLSEAIGDTMSSEHQRIENYVNLIGTEYVEYNDKGWFNEAVDFTTADTSSGSSGDTVPSGDIGRIWRDGYEKSHWFAFQEAVKAHQEYVLASIVRPVYGTMEQTTW